MRTIRDCNVCVVGGAGFLGSHLVNHLVEDRGCEVLVLDNLVAGRREFVHEKAHFLHCDITQSEDHLRKVFERGKIQYVFNYAAHPYIPDSFARPKYVFETNATGAINIINAAQEAMVEGILQVSSAEIYGYQTNERGQEIPEHREGKIAEWNTVSPHSTYGAAKAAVDYYCQTAWRERRTSVIALRQFNCVGERETHPYIVPEIISQLSVQAVQARCEICRGTGTVDVSKEPCSTAVTDCRRCNGKGIAEAYLPVVRLGNNSFRDFLYAGDAVRIAVELLERGQFGEVYNLGSETGIKMYDLAKLIGELMGFSDVRVEVDESRKRPWEIWYLRSSNDKIWRAIEWCNKGFPEGLTPLEEALKRTIAYYESNGRKWCWE